MEDFLTPDPAFWRGKRVFLTGHSGFKGVWLSCWLRQLGAQVLGFSLAPDTNPNLFDLVGPRDGVETIWGDIRDGAALAEAINRFSPDIVLHLAAQALVQRSYREPAMTFETNVMGTVNLLAAVSQTPTVQVVVVVTTDKCYENREWLWAYREDDRLGGYDPYSASKACAEIVTSAWRRSFFAKANSEGRIVAVASARAGNVIGGGDWSVDRLVPDCMRALSIGDAIVIRNPAATRPWQHVLEPLCGYLLLAEQLCKNGTTVAEAWNFGPVMDDVQPVSRVVDLITQFWGEGARWELAGESFPHEAGLLAVDATKAHKRLGWRPGLRLNEAIEWTTEWYKRHAAGAPANVLVEEQVKKYQSLRVHPNE